MKYKEYLEPSPMKPNAQRVQIPTTPKVNNCRQTTFGSTKSN